MSRNQEQRSSKLSKKSLRSPHSRDCNEDKTSVVVISEMITTPMNNNRDGNTKTSRSQEQKRSKLRTKRHRCTSSRDCNEEKTSVEVASEMITTPITQEVKNIIGKNTKISKSQEKRSSKVRKKRFRCTSSQNCNVEKTSVEIVKGVITTPTKEKRLSSENLCFQSLSDCISTIERNLKYRVEGSGDSIMRSTPLTRKNLFRISDFYAKEAEVVDEDESMSVDENMANDTTDVGDLINDSDSFPHVRRPHFHQFKASSPDIRIGRLRVADLARKHAKTRLKKRQRKKRKKWTLSTSSESQ